MSISRRKIITHEVPNDLVTEILLPLPVKSLLRFKSVCKYWKNLIEDPEFVFKHHQRGQKYFLTLSGDDGISSKIIISPEVGDKTRVVDLSHQLLRMKPIYRLRPCNGIVLLVFCSSPQLRLWNPATKELMVLPEPEFRSISNGWYQAPGFGFDFETNDYKVVIICYKRYPSSLVFAKIYSLSSDSWRETHVLLRSPSFRLVTENWHLQIDGMCFWLLKVFGDELHFAILSFDFTSEVTTTTPLPSDAPKFPGYGSDLPYYFFALNGRIAFLSPLSEERLINSRPSNSDYEIWVLNEIGNKDSWAKLYKFRPCSDMELPLLGDLKEDEVLVKSESGDLIWVHPIDPIRMRRHIDRHHSLRKRTFAYKESLVKLQRKEKEETAEKS